MKIKNELVSIKIGDKHYDFNNLILDEYLKRFAIGQLEKNKIDYLKYNRQLKYVFLKFDEPLKNMSNSSIIYNQEFDVVLMEVPKIQQTINEKQITIEYYYTGKDVIDYSDSKLKDISQFYGRKITAIGFNVWFNKYFGENENFNLPILAILDTSNYNIYLQKNQELSITRKDIITTDAIFYSNDKSKVPGPVHLAPYGVPQIIYQPNIYNDDGTSWNFFNDRGYGILYSVGLSSYSNYIDKEFVIGTDIQVEQNGTELNINGLENYLSKDSPLFSSNDLYPSSNLYPIKSNYKYIIFKYKVWQMVHSGTYDDIVATPADTSYYYYQAIPIDKFGKSNLKIKYERG